MFRVAPRLQRAIALAFFAVSLGLAEAAAARTADAPQAEPSAAPDAGESLRPGEYRWFADAAAADGEVRVVVSLPLQRAFVFRGETLIGVSTVSTGMPGYDTPTGTFPILQKRVEHRSNLYDNAPMPFMQRLTWDGVALHAGSVGAEPASHGCVRLPAAFARRLFAITSLGTQVTVTAEAPIEPSQALTIASTG